jgi:hypothetical protein
VSKKEIPQQQPVKKWERIIEDDKTYSIWRYDASHSNYNPYEVEIYHKSDKIDLREIAKHKKKAH